MSSMWPEGGSNKLPPALSSTSLYVLRSAIVLELDKTRPCGGGQILGA